MGASTLVEGPAHIEAPLRRPGFDVGGRPPRGPVRLTSRRVRRNRTTLAVVVVLAASLLAAHGLVGSGGPRTHAGHGGGHDTNSGANPRLNPDYDGDGNAVTFVFAGDVNFPVGSILAARLAADPTTALGAGAGQLLGHSNLSMVNLETALTFGVCPVPQPKEFVFWAPPAALTALRGAGATLTTEANNHGEDCGEPGLLQALTIRARKHYPVLGIGRNAHEAFTSFQTVLSGERIGIIAATQVIDADLVPTWTATPTQPGLASAYEVSELIRAVQDARRIDDTVIVFLHWGIQLDACPDPLQEPLAVALVRAGADIVVGSHAHVLLGAGHLGTALVDYGLGNFAFYNDPVPTNYTGALVVTITGRHVDGYSWRPAIEEGEIPVPVAGAEAHAIQARWIGARACTDLTAGPTRSLASVGTESKPPDASTLAFLSSY